MNASRANSRLHKSLVVFPVIALVVSVGCASASSSASSDFSAKKTTTTLAAKKKKKSSPRTTVVKGVTGPQKALSLLQTIIVQNEYKTGYSRNLFKHWIDADADTCNTREEVLISESVSKAQVDPYGCTVIAGDWMSAYDNVSHTDPSDLDIDHMVPLKEAWDSGAWSWTPAQRQAFANDLSDGRSLIAVTAGQNRSKGDKDPSNWLPPRVSYRCEYVANWIAIKAQWKLSMDQSEFGRIQNLLTSSCRELVVPAWSGKASGVVTPPSSPSSSGSGSSGQSNVVTPTSVASPSSQQSGLPTITPGAFCTPEGAKGEYSGRSYVCSTTNASGVPYSNGAKRWRQG